MTLLGPSKHRTTAVLASSFRDGAPPADSYSRTFHSGEVQARVGTGPTVEPKSLAKRILLSAAG